VVNAGGILLIRLSMLATDDLARGLTILAGAATMVYGAVIMLVKPDIKGALAHSTAAQMGFMILTCGLGLWAAAVIHLVAHGFYKAMLFLSSGSAVARYRRQEALPPPVPGSARRHRWAHVVVAVGLPTVALAAGIAAVPIPAGDHAAEQALLIFAWVTGAAVTWGWLQRRSGLVGVLIGGAVLVAAAVGYVAIINGLGGFLAPALPASTLPTSTVWLITATAALALGALALTRRAPSAEGLRRALYTNALTAGHIPSRQSSPVTTGARS
jgi:NADH:ubiquinone oxidoreductase subunit 5 (subunit L)/multisubunit Na+/H+ antiporter MnhA subunit